MRRLVDLALDAVLLRARRRARGGERVWVAAFVALWLVRRARRTHGTTLWQGSVCSGEHLSVSVEAPVPRRSSRAR